MIIVVAILVAHFVDKAFYTFKKSSEDADQNIMYLSIALKVCIMISICITLCRIRYVVTKEHTINLRTRLWNIHVIFITSYYILWGGYELFYTMWMLDPNH